MKNLRLTAQFVLPLLFVAATGLGNSQQGVMPYPPQITIGEKKIIVSQESINTWRSKARSTAASAGPRGSRGSVAALARDFGLMKKTASNPTLAFDTEDITYWEKRKLDETNLALEFAARKLILEEADLQGIKIPGREALSQAASQVIPLLKEQQKNDQSSLLGAVVCTGRTSQEFVTQAWEELTKNPQKSLLCSDKTIQKWTRQADAQQAKATREGCSDPPPSSDFKSYSAAYWALSDVATSWFIRGEVYSQQAKWPEARAAYKTVIDKYRCAFTWDQGGGWFWRTADSAQEKYDEIRLK